MTIAQLRERACDRAVWPATRDLVFTGGVDAERVAHAIFETLAPARALRPLEPCEGHTYNLAEDRATVTAGWTPAGRSIPRSPRASRPAGCSRGTD